MKTSSTSLFKKISQDKNVSDEEFDSIYSSRVQKLASLHFTSIEICLFVSKLFQASTPSKILDIGAGAGKFCIVGALTSQNQFVGVEPRLHLCREANQIISTNHITNAEIYHANILEVDFSHYDHFYFFNSFQQYLLKGRKSVHTIAKHKNLYKEYNQYVKNQLNQMPSGTKLVTYYSPMDEIPNTFTLYEKYFDSKLKLWKRI